MEVLEAKPLLELEAENTKLKRRLIEMILEKTAVEFALKRKRWSQQQDVMLSAFSLCVFFESGYIGEVYIRHDHCDEQWDHKPNDFTDTGFGNYARNK